MTFPASYSTTLILKTKKYQANAKILVRNILISLQKEQVSRAHNIANSIYFKGGFSFLGSWNILLPVSSGTILVQEQNGEIYISYKLKFNNRLMLTTIIVPTFSCILLLTQTNFECIQISKSLLLAWLLLFGGSYLLSIFSFPIFIKKTLNSEI